MNSRAAPFPGSMRVLALTLIAVLALVVLRTASVAPDAAQRMVTVDGDSIMRFLSVRDWLNGQGWFDMSNARVLPPEGLSLHWSRYVDLGIAGVIGALSLVLPSAEAEALAFVVWPALLLVCFVAITMVTTLRLFGPGAAAGAILAVVLWQLTARNHFGPMVLDHHGVQILLLAVVVFTLVVEGPEIRRGVLGGAAAGLSLAVGLENLLPIAAAGLILAMLAVLRGDGGHRQLRAFGVTLFGAALLLHLGQTAPSDWTRTRCDELGPPILGLLGLAALAAVGIGGVAARAPGLGIRVAALAGFGAIAAAGAAWVVQACPDFPYGNLSEDLRHLIRTRITEARPALAVFAAAEPEAFSHLLPGITTTLVATGVALWRWRTGRAGAAETRAVAILMVFAWLGTVGVFAQVRLVVLSAPVVPILIGYCLAALFDARRQLPRPALASLASVVTLAGALLPGQLYHAVATITAAHASAPEAGEAGDTRPNAGTTGACASAANISGLNGLPPGRVLASPNLGPAILVGTDHSVVAVLYHRSAEAIGNAFAVVLGDEAAFLSVIEQSRPDYLVLCPGFRHDDGSAYVTRLMEGDTVAGFVPVEGLGTDLMVFEVTQ